MTGPGPDFVIADPDDGDEVLQTGRDRSVVRRLRLDLLGGAVVLAGTLLAAQALAHKDHKTTAPPSASASTSPRVYGTGAPDSGSGLLNGMATVEVTPAASGTPGRLPAATSPDPTSCPRGVTCHEIDTVAAPARDAVRAAFPGARIESATTVRLAAPPWERVLWFVQVNARAGSREIVVRIQAPRRDDVERTGVDRVQGRAITYYEHAALGYHVSVQVDAPAASRQPVAALAQLAGDRRLLADG